MTTLEARSGAVFSICAGSPPEYVPAGGRLHGMTMTILALSAVAAALPGLLIWILDAVKR
ncbi:MAG TPA: hypothetical protein VFP78_05315 [Solirubrobacteraceae bacterium]|nr:hypothetical protein [Solirubrobacteraceae bacterium]